jgi:hypothetical protein
MRPDELERRLRERLDALGPAPGAELLHVLMLPDLEGVETIKSRKLGRYVSQPFNRTPLLQRSVPGPPYNWSLVSPSCPP